MGNNGVSTSRSTHLPHARHSTTRFTLALFPPLCGVEPLLWRFALRRLVGVGNLGFATRDGRFGVEKLEFAPPMPVLGEEHWGLVGRCRVLRSPLLGVLVGCCFRFRLANVCPVNNGGDVKECLNIIHGVLSIGFGQSLAGGIDGAGGLAAEWERVERERRSSAECENSDNMQHNNVTTHFEFPPL